MVNFECLVRRQICSTPAVMNLSKIGRLFLASLLAVNGLPALGSYNATPIDRNTVLQNWANALGMSGDLAQDGGKPRWVTALTPSPTIISKKCKNSLDISLIFGIFYLVDNYVWSAGACLP